MPHAADVAAIRSLYIHIPFCERKCEYCDFTSVAGTSGAEEYMSALCAEIRMLAASLPPITLDTVFVGGGTPSLVDPTSLASLLGEVRTRFRMAPDAEVTMEANPSSISAARARIWREAGFNRLSIGVQSLEPDILAFLGRVHDERRALAAIADARAGGFEHVSCDLIYAVPGLDDARWRRTLQQVVAAAPEHVSCYELTVEPGTPLHTSVRRGRVPAPDTDRALAQHAIGREQLGAASFEQYEVSNFAQPGARSRHNLVYWRNGYYLAAGVGAHGHVPAAAAAACGVTATGAAAVAVRYWHGRGIRAYCGAVHDGLLPVRDVEEVSAHMRDEESIMLGLRLNEGVALRDGAVIEEARVLERAGLLQLDGDVARTTQHGEALLNAVTLRLVHAMREPAAVAL